MPSQNISVHPIRRYWFTSSSIEPRRRPDILGGSRGARTRIPLLKITAYFTTRHLVVLLYQTRFQLCAVKSLPGQAVTFRRGADLHSLLYLYKIQSAIMRAVNKYVGVRLSIAAFAQGQLNSAWTSNILPPAA